MARRTRLPSRGRCSARAQPSHHHNVKRSHQRSTLPNTNRCIRSYTLIRGYGHDRHRRHSRRGARAAGPESRPRPGQPADMPIFVMPSAVGSVSIAANASTLQSLNAATPEESPPSLRAARLTRSTAQNRDQPAVRRRAVGHRLDRQSRPKLQSLPLQSLICSCAATAAIGCVTTRGAARAQHGLSADPGHPADFPSRRRPFVRCPSLQSLQRCNRSTLQPRQNRRRRRAQRGSRAARPETARHTAGSRRKCQISVSVNMRLLCAAVCARSSGSLARERESEAMLTDVPTLILVIMCGQLSTARL